MNKNISNKILITLSFFLLSFFGFSQDVELKNPADTVQNKLINTFYLIGDSGHQNNEKPSAAVLSLKKHLNLQTAEKLNNSYLIFLGDNSDPSKNHFLSEGQSEGAFLPSSLAFIPGEIEWERNGIDGLKENENFYESNLIKQDVFLPKSGCAFSFVDISDSVHLILLDSQWFLENWDEHPLINDNCPEIKTREAMLAEIETELKKNQNKTTIIAMHHPIRSNGVYGGKFGGTNYLDPIAKKIPVPLVGQVFNLIRTSGGISPQDAGNTIYSALISRLETISAKWGNVIFASGHDHSLQYIKEDHIRQVVVGSGSINAYVRNFNSSFASKEEGFGALEIYSDGSSKIKFYGLKDEKPVLLFEEEIFSEDKFFDTSSLPDNFPEYTTASVYGKEETEKSNFYTQLWGERYRELYSTDIKIPIADLRTLYGGLTPIRLGGGNQTSSLRVKDSLDREYNFRMLRKDGVQFLQATAFKDKLVEDDFRETFAEEMIKDFYTASHPFAFLAIPTLANAAEVLHTNPELYFLPKQPALGNYNNDHGGEIYMIEERPEEHWLGYESFGSPNHDIQSTEGMYDRLRRDEQYSLDEASYIRSRLFDMLIGDWDRHGDQWRWAEIELENGDRVFKPIPRDRDQVFSNFDGSVFNTLRGIIGFINQFGKYSEDIEDLEWFNRSAANLDRSLVQNSGKEVWVSQAEFLQKNVTDSIIEKAFTTIPDGLNTDTTTELIEKLKGRRENIVNIAERYYDQLSDIAIITGTDKDDYIDVTRMEGGKTNVRITRNKDGERDEVVNERTYYEDETKEIWIYGLDDEDKFYVKGEYDTEIKVKLIGGQNNDIYNIDQGKDVKIYDFKSKKNTVEKKDKAKVYFTDNYDINIFDKDRKISNKNSFLPYIGYNPDDGLILGIRNTITIDNVVRNPFTTQHNFKGGYFFATKGFELEYAGEFAHAKRNHNLLIGAYFSSPKNVYNFFGFGNESYNHTDDFSRDYNRVRISTLRGEIGLIRRGQYGSIFTYKTLIEGIKTEDTPNRFITAEFNEDSQLFERTYYMGLEGEYIYESYDNSINPSKGLYVNFTAGGKMNIQETDKNFLYINPHLELFTPLSPDGKLVLNPRIQAEINFSNKYEFFQAATVGGKSGLRSFRHERFAGDQAFAAGSDLRYSFDSIENGFLPLQIGVLSGYDIGRVWLSTEESNLWHQSYGGGFWVSIAKVASANFNLFHGSEGLRFSFQFEIGL